MHFAGFAAIATLVLLAACSTTPQHATPPAPPLVLLDAGALALPRDCEPAPGKVYRTGYTVQADGSVADPTAQSGSGCIQDALRDWVSTFRYRPPGVATTTVIDWLAVTASRGG
jgi:hypothetical protein